MNSRHSVLSGVRDLQLNTLRELGCNLAPGARVLDFGCGGGALVLSYRDAGFEAWGCDPGLPETPEVDAYRRQGILRPITNDPYRVPFDDNSMDLVVSNMVFEHVRNYNASFSEIRRVLKPDGLTLHAFPSRYQFCEPHVRVPLGTMLQRRWWLALWAHAGVRNEYQLDKTAQETIDLNHAFLTKGTNYLSKREIQRILSRHFGSVDFCERAMMQFTPNGRALYRKLPGLPRLAGWLYSTFAYRVILARHPAADAPSTAAVQRSSWSEQSAPYQEI